MRIVNIYLNRVGDIILQGIVKCTKNINFSN